MNLSGPVVEYLDTYKKHHGEEAWKAEILKLARQAIPISPKHEEFWRNLTKDYDWLNFDDLKKEAAAAPPAAVPDMNLLLAQAIKTQMPGCKSQAQFTAFRTAFEAFRMTLNAIFEEDRDKEEEARKALEAAFKVAGQATEITRKLGDVPEAATSKAAQEFKSPPAEFQEYDVQRQLLTELVALNDTRSLGVWYEATKEKRDSIKSQSLRNSLLDAIRERKLALQKAEEEPLPSGSDEPIR